MIFGLALTKHVAGFFDVMLALKQYDADVYVTGHVGRTGTVADLDNQIAVFEDIRDGAQKGLKGMQAWDGVHAVHAYMLDIAVQRSTSMQLLALRG